ncbi:hypothetical protein AKJ57_00325 [candidate division MSBL1 archaeon SCGC-AAA259A05]|uniref:Transglutaminase-like domain-containing protein n=1 Tax=candidate division MSBL1 archaeon SCGC-AAA259A05 TaxID=1698259 RepID=A0A133UBW4_9EURY|nr:hypothetical protein AKJ57_00325 [candidate division MSBL1 archaeon SCGC-AAA259A05]
MRNFFVGVLSILLIVTFLASASADRTSNSTVYRINKKYRIVNNSSSDATDVNLTFYAFDNFENWAYQRVLSENIALGFPKEITHNPDNRIVNVDLGRIESEKSVTISVSYLVRVDAVYMDLEPEGVRGDIPSGYENYTKPIDNLWQSDNPLIKNKSHELTAGLTNYYCKVKKLAGFVENHLSYELQPQECSAFWAYEHGWGDCAEYTNLIIALCRAENIPTKMVRGYLPFTRLYGSKTNELPEVGHKFAIVYLPSEGWVPLDLTYLIDGEFQFGNLSNKHIVKLVSDGRNLVRDSTISIPDARISYSYKKTNPNLQILISGQVKREVAITTKILSQIRSHQRSLEISVKVSNEGLRRGNGVKVKLTTENEYFDVPSPRKIPTLGPGESKTLQFELGMKKSAENKLVKAIVLYNAPGYENLRYEDRLMVTTTVSHDFFEPLVKMVKEILEKRFYLIILIMVLLAGAAFVVRR